MRSIKVLATESTNLFLRDMYRDNPALENCYVSAEHQTKGKGQMGATWTAEVGKNLTFSVLLNDIKLPLNEQFKLSALTAMAVFSALRELGIPKLAIKWPNDILADTQKVCGILIENILSGNKIGSTIIGIGLNVNQTEFDGLRQASSLKNLSGKTYDREHVLDKIVAEIEQKIYAMKDRSIQHILEEYRQFLFRFEKPSTFEFPNGSQEPGIIQGVTVEGYLKVLFEDEQLRKFDIKEIKLLY